MRDVRSADASEKPTIELLVTDLDNTLYDWVSFFAVAFYRMVEVAAGQLDVGREVLLDDLRAIHRAHHNSEQPFALLDTKTVSDRLPGLSRRERKEYLDDAFHAFNSARKALLTPYPNVLDTLERIDGSGCTIVGHTEATAVNAQFRLAMLGLAKYLKRLYAAENRGKGHPAPELASRVVGVPSVTYLARGELKPAPGVLLNICADNGVDPSRTLYVGDSVSRDVGMAKEAGVWVAHAQYGTRYPPEYWPMLVRISHWHEDDVRRAELAESMFGQVEPDARLDEGFAQILGHFRFSRTPS